MPQNPETFIKVTVARLKNKKFQTYPKWKSVTLENKTKKMKVVNIAASRAQFSRRMGEKVSCFQNSLRNHDNAIPANTKIRLV